MSGCGGLCAKARRPLQQELVHQLGIEELDIKVAAVCVYHRFVETARRALEGSGIARGGGFHRISRRLSIRLKNELPRCAAQLKPARKRSISSLPVRWCSRANGRSFTTRSRIFGRPVAPLT